MCHVHSPSFPRQVTHVWKIQVHIWYHFMHGRQETTGTFHKDKPTQQWVASCASVWHHLSLINRMLPSPLFMTRQFMFFQKATSMQERKGEASSSLEWGRRKTSSSSFLSASAGDLITLRLSLFEGNYPWNTGRLKREREGKWNEKDHPLSKSVFPRGLALQFG